MLSGAVTVQPAAAGFQPGVPQHPPWVPAVQGRYSLNPTGGLTLYKLLGICQPDVTRLERRVREI